MQQRLTERFKQLIQREVNVYFWYFYQPLSNVDGNILLSLDLAVGVGESSEARAGVWGERRCTYNGLKRVGSESRCSGCAALVGRTYRS